MFISCEKNAVITTNNQTIISDGNLLTFENKTFFTVSYTDGHQQTAIVADTIIKSEGIYSVFRPDGIMLCFVKKKRYDKFVLIAQDFSCKVRTTVYGDNGLKITLETDDATEIVSLDFFSLNAKIYTAYYSYGTIIAVHFTDAKKVVVYLYRLGSFKQVLLCDCDTLLLDKYLTVEFIKKDMLQHLITTEYEAGETLNIINKKVTRKFNDTYTLSNELLPFAFIEEVLVGGNFADFLGENLLDRTTAVKEYFGNFIKVVVLPDNFPGLVYKSDGLYDYTIKKLSCTFNGNKIENFTLID